MDNKYWYIAAGFVLAILWFRHNKLKKALADVMTDRPPSSGYAGPMAIGKGGQDTQQGQVLSQRRFQVPTTGATRFGSTASGGSSNQPSEGLSPPGSMGSGRKKY